MTDLSTDCISIADQCAALATKYADLATMCAAMAADYTAQAAKLADMSADCDRRARRTVYAILLTEELAASAAQYAADHAALTANQQE